MPFNCIETSEMSLPRVLIEINIRISVKFPLKAPLESVYAMSMFSLRPHPRSLRLP